MNKLPERLRRGWRWGCRGMGGISLLLSLSLCLPYLREGLQVGLWRLAFPSPPPAEPGVVDTAQAALPLPGIEPPADWEEELPELPDREDAPSVLPPLAGVLSLDLSPADPLTLLNMTASLSPSPAASLAAWESEAQKNAPAVAPAAVGSSVTSPTVLVLHTHATEAFGGDADHPAPRSSDPSQNMVAVGDALCEALQARGISVLHCRELIDEPDFATAYEREKALILSYLEQYPGIRCILDLHRDAVEREGIPVRAVTTLDGMPVAQIMFVVGTNEKGAAHPHWQQNFGYALHLQSALAAAHPGLTRAVNLRGASFNEQYTPRSLLVEIGTAANTLEEAIRAARLLGNAIAETF